MAKKTTIVPASNSLVHRGRFQAQGIHLEESVAWADVIPPSTEEGKAMILKLQSKLKRRDADLREEAFSKAKNFISTSFKAGGINAERKKTFKARHTCQERVDVEILGGVAFKKVKNI
ncbi:hypothetical protein ABEG96_21860 [Pantoea agglomerans]|uniref:hypothetical protein n=1 Tax=Enterobacter agglomerans TaxID=549 RepID=UPI003207CC90